MNEISSQNVFIGSVSVLYKTSKKHRCFPLTFVLKLRLTKATNLSVSRFPSLAVPKGHTKIQCDIGFFCFNLQLCLYVDASNHKHYLLLMVVIKNSKRKVLKSASQVKNCELLQQRTGMLTRPWNQILLFTHKRFAIYKNGPYDLSLINRANFPFI